MKLHIKKAIALIISVVMIITSLLLPSAVFAKSDSGNISNKAEYVEGEVICVLNNNVTSNYMKAASTKTVYGSSFSQKSTYKIGDTQTVVLKSSTLSTKEMVSKLKKNPAVKYAIPNYIKHAYGITNDTYSNYQWALDNTGQNGGTAGLDTNADVLWADAESSEKEQVVAIVDTGVDYNHPELKDVMWNNPYGKKLLGKHGRDFTGTITDGEPLDDNGHGTHCAGIIAAQANNNAGISGINQSNVKIMALKFLDKDGSGSLDSALAAYDFIIRAVKLGTNVVACNNSWGGFGNYEELMLLDMIYDELGKLGVITFAAAGNEEMDLDFDENEEDPLIITPASCQSDYVITVAATDEKDDLADFSNYGKKSVDIAAPGTEILSTVSYNRFNPTIYNATQKSELCAYMQDYNSPVGASDFGYFKETPYDTNGTYKDVVSDNYSFSYVDGFGVSGNALQISLNEKTTKKRPLNIYAFEVPFTITDKDTDYSISVAIKGNNEYEGLMYDVPATETLDDVFGMIPEDLYFIGCNKDNFWRADYVDIDIDPVDEKGEPLDTDYEKSTERKLMFVFATYKDDTVITIDDLAISTQGADPDDFGKYDFYNGTSMATPYVTGAAALIMNARPDASTLDVINMIKNTGRDSAALNGKTQNAKVLSLNNTESIPPMITQIDYNKAKNIEITGSFRNITKVTANGTEVTPLSTSNNSIIINDSNYNTQKLTVTVENPYGTTEFDALISDKPGFDIVDMDTIPDTYSSFVIPAGDSAYYINSMGAIGMLSSSEFEDDMYEYMELGQINAESIFKDGTCGIVSAAKLNGDIYACVLHYISGAYNDNAILGYEAALVRYDLETMTTTKIADIPEESLSGSTLTAYNSELYLIGGCDFTDTFECSSSVYKLNTSKKEFVKMTATLPEGRAGATFIQYKNKLIGMYGMNDAGTMPGIIIFDGKTWKESKVTLTSDDPSSETDFTGKTLRVFEGNLGYGSNGIFANGPYVYGLGDSFTYNPDNDTVTACKNSAKNKIGGLKLLGTTVGSKFVGFEVKSLFDDMGGDVAVGALSYIFGDTNTSETSITGSNSEENENKAYIFDTNAKYPTVDVESSLTNASVKSDVMNSYLYGDTVNITLAPNAGYAITSIKSNGTVVSTNSNSAKIIVKSPAIKITNTAKLVAAPVTNLKVTKAGSKTCTLTWTKAKTGSGYQIQKYANGKWSTVATIKNLKTTTYKAAVRAGAVRKYRVRAYGVYNKKTVYGAAAVKSIYVPKKQNIKSVKGAKGAFTVKYTKDSKATGYVIQYSKQKNFKSKKSIAVKKNSVVSKKIKAKKGKYYVRVRSYKKVDGKTIYGAYSKAKTVTVK